MLQATTPFREASAVDEAIDRLVEGGFDTVVSVTEDRTLNWREEDGLLVPLFDKEGRREEQAPIYKENGAVVALRRAVVDGPTRFGDRVGWLVLDKRAGFTVYDLEDFWMAERLLRQPRVLFRVDGSSSVGMGHVFRSLAIAEALRGLSRADIAFLMSADHTEGLVTVSRAGYAVRVVGRPQGRDLPRPHPRLRPRHPDQRPARRWTARTCTALSHLGATTVNLVDTIDDLETTEHYAQVIVSVMNQERETPEGFYGGPAYAILREHFRGRDKEVRDDAAPRAPQLRRKRPPGPHPQGGARAAGPRPRGGAGGGGRSRLLLPARVRGPLGRAAPRRVPLINEAGGHIAELMLEADVMVGSGGMSVYEIAALGTPGIILGQNAREDRRMRDFARSRNRRLPGPRHGGGRGRPRLRGEGAARRPRAPAGHERTRAARSWTASGRRGRRRSCWSAAARPRVPEGQEARR